MTIRYGSVCSGIEAATMAWHSLGWEAAFFSEIEAFPSAVLAHHYGSNMPGEPLAKNGIPNYGDFTQIGPDAGPVDLLVGGTPCQSFSVAGKRLGLDDSRGNLALEYLALARRLRARWIVWENVPGVLSSHTDDEQGEEGDDGFESADFATFLSFVQECGYGFAYRVLDAQYIRVDEFARAVPQRRRRVFLVGYLGDWRRAAAVLFEPESMRGDSAPRRSQGQGFTRDVAQCLVSRGRGVERTGDTRGQDNVVAEPVSPPVTRNPYGDHESREGLLVAFGGNNQSGPIDVSTAVNAHGGPAGRLDFESETFVAHALRGGGFDASEDGTGRGTPIVPVAFDCKASGRNGFAVGEISPTLRSMGHLNSNQNAGGQVAVQQGWAVRRLMPVECERLQGFPDNFSNVPWRGKQHAPDGPRYKALGNSMAVNAMRWIGQRIDIMEKLIREGRV